MCERHGLPYARAARLLPLIERALVSPTRQRDRLLLLVENNLARKARRQPPASLEPAFDDLDAEVLVSVARVLHAWTPPRDLLDLRGVLPEIFPGLDLE